MCIIAMHEDCAGYWKRSWNVCRSGDAFDVKFDSKFSTRTRVPVDDILPVPKQLMSLPCWLFNEVPGAGCL